MSITAEKIVTDAMALPPVLRAFVAEKLIESLDESAALPLSEKWKEEIRRRCAELDSSAGNLRDADEVFKNAYASLT
jgi:putative addiction module component (TIGR02574 family)